MTGKRMIELVQQHHPHIGETECTILLDQAKNEFMEDAGIYRTIYASATTTAGQLLYDMNLGADSFNVQRIISVYVGDSGSEIKAARLQGSLNIKDST